MSSSSRWLTESESDREIEAFYDGLAGDYHLLFADWRASVERQGAVLDQVIRDALGPGPKRVLDCSCGIGTQAIGLARIGHSLTGTDVSAPAIRRAEAEAERLGVEIDFRVCDMRELARCVDGEFDVIISCDNALPHLLSVEVLGAAIGSIYSCLPTGGAFIASTRDYDAILLERPIGTPVGLSTIDGTRRLVFQVWEWEEDGRTYTFEQFVGSEENGRWELRSWRSKYRALTRSELSAALNRGGFTESRWIMPAESGYFQPLIVARKG